jgi:hypothetical protein
MPEPTPEQIAVMAYARDRAFARAINCMKAMSSDQMDVDYIQAIWNDIRKPAELKEEPKPMD